MKFERRHFKVRFAMDDGDHKEIEKSETISMPELLEPDDPIPDDLQIPMDSHSIPDLPDTENEKVYLNEFEDPIPGMPDVNAARHRLYS